MIGWAKRLMDHPSEHSKYGIYILVFSIIGGGNLLTLIGGILAMTYQPMPAQPYAQQPYQSYQPYTQQPPTQAQPSQYASAKYCPQCGNAVGAEAAFCPKCGTKLPT
jgi:membrane protease subunit (stomatin/prohibitin family)